GGYDEAIERGREALALHRELRADDLDREARLVGRLGSVEMRRERLDAAEALIREAAAVFERLYGEAHPTIAVGLMNLGGIELQRNEPAKAVVLLERALATLERFHGPDHPNVLGALNNLATTLTSLERYAEARTHLERGLARADEGGQRGELYGALLYNLGQNAHYSNDLPSAERWYQRAIDFHAESHGADHPRTAGARYALGSVLLAAARPREAAAALAAALPVHEQHPGHGGWDLAYTRADLGRAHTDLGDHRRALPLLEAALPPLAETGDTLQVGLTTFALARALWATGQRRRALGHAAATAAMWTDPQFAAELAKLTTWRHGKQP
ncbi:MAG TPA: tetratricopeptide repeat protein, partial [Kofleriaceae bacterium]|nr:tetratricopeptide repeat protein [Kofleriaceae bacterium]